MASILSLSQPAHASPAQAAPSPNETLLLENAESTVRNYLAAGQQFPFFAVAMRPNGETEMFVPSDEFEDDKAAFEGLLHTLLSEAWEGRLQAVAIVTPMDPPEGFRESAAMFDLEERDRPRFNVILPYRMGPNGVEYADKIVRSATPKLFLRPRPTSDDRP